jgi:aqualysin 1
VPVPSIASPLPRRERHLNRFCDVENEINHFLGAVNMKKVVLVSVALCAGALAFTLLPSKSSAKNDKFRRSAQAISGRYLVVLNDLPGLNPEVEVGNEVASLEGKYRGKIDKVFTRAINGYAAEMDEDEAIRLSNDPKVKYVEEDAVVTISTTENNAPWGIDRVDQRSLPLNLTYTYTPTGSGVNAYIIDTGIRPTHTDFGGRASIVFDSVGDGRNGNDCNGHGTHVAGTIGGNTYGVAKGVRLNAVRVLNCNGSGSITGVIAGMDWVAANAVKPAVVNMSLGANATTSLDDAVNNLTASGVTVVVAAGNASMDACGFSPARAASAITVGATDEFDRRAYFSNIGACLDVFAPGLDITSAWIGSDSAFNIISGTSMASPHVAGIAALFLEQNPTAIPSSVSDMLTRSATPGAVSDAGTGSPNLLGYSYVPRIDGSCSGTQFAGNIAQSGQNDFQSSSSGFAGGTGTFSGTLDVPAGTQFTLALEKKKGKAWGAVASSSGSGAVQSVSYAGRSGTYRWNIKAISGSGSYGLCSIKP